MLTLITAVPGSGKTLYTVQRIDEFLRQREPDPETPLEPRPARLVFTNIPLDVECFMEPGNITLFETPEPGSKTEVFDWRDTPSGSLIVYDEAQFFFPTKVLEKRTEEIIEAMSTHRHQGYDIVVITQSPRLLNATVKSLCGKHIHLYRAFGMEGATVYEWQHQVENPNSRVEQLRAVQTIFKFPKRYYGYYQSAEQHTHKLHFPAKLKRLLALMLLVLAGVGYLFWRDGGLNIVTGGKALAPKASAEAMATQTDLATQTAGAATSGTAVVPGAVQVNKAEPDLRDLPYGWSSTPTAAPISGCVANKKRGICQCYGEGGGTVALEQAQCLSTLSKPIPRNILRK